MFFGLTKLPQTSCSFSKTSRSAKTKFQHLETLSNKTKTKNHDEITRKTMQCRIASYKMYTMETKCPDRVQCPDSALMDEVFFSCPSPLPFDASTVLSLTRRPAGNRTTTGSPSATQECRDTNWATRTPSSDRWRWASQNIKSIIPHPVQCPDSTLTVVLVTQLVSRHSCVANRLVWSATTIQKRISLSGQQTNSFSESFCELQHSDFSPLCPWQSWLWLFWWALPRSLFCFVSLLDGEAHLAGGTAFRPLRFVCVVLCFWFAQPTWPQVSM